ncbi:hypothetical protein CYMTET_11507, partial [Cymbomonas tetramitiformis]
MSSYLSSWLSSKFSTKLPDGVVEVSADIYAFDHCIEEFLDTERVKERVSETTKKLLQVIDEEHIMVFAFGDTTQSTQWLCEVYSHVLSFPNHYEKSHVLSLDVLQSICLTASHWLSMDNGTTKNKLLLFCECSEGEQALQLLAFIVSSILLFRQKELSEQKALESVWRAAKSLLPRHGWSPPVVPSQMRYLQYFSRAGGSESWPPPSKTLLLDCVMLRTVPAFGGDQGCCPVVRIHGCDTRTQSTEVLFSQKSGSDDLLSYRQEEADVLKIDVQCAVSGDVLLECVHMELPDPLSPSQTEVELQPKEHLMFRVVFNTAFVRSNMLMLGVTDIDIDESSKHRFQDSFRLEVLLSEECEEAVQSARDLTELILASPTPAQRPMVSPTASVIDPACAELMSTLVEDFVQLHQEEFVIPGEHPTCGAAGEAAAEESNVAAEQKRQAAHGDVPTSPSASIGGQDAGEQAQCFPAPVKAFDESAQGDCNNDTVEDMSAEVSQVLSMGMPLAERSGCPREDRTMLVEDFAQLHKEEFSMLEQANGEANGEAPAYEAPAGEAFDDEALADEATASEAFDDEALADDAANEDPADEAAGEARADEAPADEAAGEARADEAAGEARADEAAGEARADEAAGEARADEAAGEAPADEAPADEAAGEARADEAAGEARADEAAGEARADEAAGEARADEAAGEAPADTVTDVALAGVVADDEVLTNKPSHEAPADLAISGALINEPSHEAPADLATGEAAPDVVAGEAPANLVNCEATVDMATDEALAGLVNGEATAIEAAADVANKDVTANVANAEAVADVANTEVAADLVNAEATADVANKDVTANVANAEAVADVANTEVAADLVNAESAADVADTEVAADVANAEAVADVANAEPPVTEATGEAPVKVDLVANGDQCSAHEASGETPTTDTSGDTLTNKATGKVPVNEHASKIADTPGGDLPIFDKADGYQPKEDQPGDVDATEDDGDARQAVLRSVQKDSELVSLIDHQPSGPSEISKEIKSTSRVASQASMACPLVVKLVQKESSPRGVSRRSPRTSPQKAGGDSPLCSSSPLAPKVNLLGMKKRTHAPTLSKTKKMAARVRQFKERNRLKPKPNALDVTAAAFGSITGSPDVGQVHRTGAASTTCDIGAPTYVKGGEEGQSAVPDVPAAVPGTSGAGPSGLTDTHGRSSSTLPASFNTAGDEPCTAGVSLATASKPGLTDITNFSSRQNSPSSGLRSPLGQDFKTLDNLRSPPTAAPEASDASIPGSTGTERTSSAHALIGQPPAHAPPPPPSPSPTPPPPLPPSLPHHQGACLEGHPPMCSNCPLHHLHTCLPPLHGMIWVALFSPPLRRETLGRGPAATGRGAPLPWPMKQRKMRPLHWQKLQQHMLTPESLWLGCIQGSDELDVNMKELEKLFSAHLSPKSAKNAVEGLKPKKVAFLVTVDMRRANNCEAPQEALAHDATGSQRHKQRD